jgi:phenylacetate-coenzyme A ligase PaaK-like adenylate-forming protein
VPRRLRGRIELVGRRALALDRLDPRQLREQTLARMQRLVDGHLEGSANPAYRDLLEEQNVRMPVRLRTLDDLAKLPIIDKSFLARAGYAERPATTVGGIVTVETSGTTSSVVRIPHSLRSVHAGLGDSFLRSLASGGLGTETSYWTIGHQVRPGQQTGSVLSFDWLRRVAPQTLVTGTTDDLAIQLDLASRVSPDCIASSPGFLTRLAAYIAENQLTTIAPTVVLYGGAALSDAGRQMIMDSMGPDRIIAFYPTTDAGPIGWSPYDDGQYATFTETHFVEVVDSDGAPVEAGARGDVLATVLDNRAAPLIRYRIGDQVTLHALGNRLVVGDIERTGEVSLGDGMLSISEVESWAPQLRKRGFPVSGVQLRIGHAESGLDQATVRVFGTSDWPNAASNGNGSTRSTHRRTSAGVTDELARAVRDLVASNWQMAIETRSGSIAPLLVELVLTAEWDGWKGKPIFDERINGNGAPNTYNAPLGLLATGVGRQN